MYQFIGSLISDKGIVKKVNEDSCYYGVAQSDFGEIVLAIVCDGVGGLDSGEIASSSVIQKFKNWFNNEFYELLEKNFEEELKKVVIKKIDTINESITNYGKEKQKNLGTTFCMLLIFNKKYYVFNIGDSRVYKINDEVKVLTKDQTLAQRCVDNGEITLEQAKSDRRNSVLLQCVGASPKVKPEILVGDVIKDDVYIVCSDGFRHKIDEDYMQEKFNAKNLENDVDIQKSIAETIEYIKDKKERDNITGIVIRVV